MFTRANAIFLSILLVFFVLQEGFLNQFHLVGGGFSLFFILIFVWSAISIQDNALMLGFIAGFLLDLAQGSDAPVGLWTLIMVLTCYLVSYFSYGDAAPIGIVAIVTVANFAAQILFLTMGALLGIQVGDLVEVLITLIGTSVWTLVVTPIFLPLFTSLHNFTLKARN
jgi:rod shape-determining protein MreD